MYTIVRNFYFKPSEHDWVVKNLTKKTFFGGVYLVGEQRNRFKEFETCKQKK